MMKRHQSRSMCQQRSSHWQSSASAGQATGRQVVITEPSSLMIDPIVQHVAWCCVYTKGFAMGIMVSSWYTNSLRFLLPCDCTQYFYPGKCRSCHVQWKHSRQWHAPPILRGCLSQQRALSSLCQPGTPAWSPRSHHVLGQAAVGSAAPARLHSNHCHRCSTSPLFLPAFSHLPFYCSADCLRHV